MSALNLESAHAKMMADSASAMGEQANFNALTKIKSYLTVRSPFDGVITERDVHDHCDFPSERVIDFYLGKST